VRVENEKLERLAMEKLLAVEKKAAENVLELAKEDARIAKGKTIKKNAN
jgi:NOL1/NOP2/fmu family ribosome biogenesis protein